MTNQTLPYLEILFFHVYSLYKQCNPKPGAPPYSRCDGISGSPSSSLVIKTLAFASDTGSLVVIGRFHDLGITGERICFIHCYIPLLLALSGSLFELSMFCKCE